MNARLLIAAALGLGLSVSAMARPEEGRPRRDFGRDRAEMAERLENIKREREIRAQQERAKGDDHARAREERAQQEREARARREAKAEEGKVRREFHDGDGQRAQDKEPNHREVRQSRRIGAGVKSGRLTAEETAKLEAEQARIKAETEAARADGKVTKEEAKDLNQERNEASKGIWEEKHDSETAVPVFRK